MNTESTFYIRAINLLASAPAPQDILDFKITQEEDDRMQYLMSVHNNGELSVAELDELQKCVTMNRILSLAKLRAQGNQTGFSVAA